MKILFCTEGFIIDGVAAYNLYLSAALKQAGHRVAILGRWAGFKGFQERQRKLGVVVLQCPSAGVGNPWLLSQARRFKPDVVITDSRRAFPLAQRVRRLTGAKVVTVFQDPPQPDRKGNRGLQALMADSDAWVTSEAAIFRELEGIEPQIPVRWFQRPFTGVIRPTPLPPRDPFRVLCLGRLSRWKTPGFRALVREAADLQRSIPNLEITFLGGGRRVINFRLAAAKANLKAGRSCVHVPGTRSDPQGWLEQATVVCAGAGSAIEGILSNRPVLAFSGFWMGRVRADNLDYGINSHFGEREGQFYVREKPGVVAHGLKELYDNWHDETMAAEVAALRRKLEDNYDSRRLAAQFDELCRQL